MLNQAKCSPNSRRLPTESTLAPSAAQVEAEPPPLPEGLSRPTPGDEPLYSIRVADRPDAVCAVCGKHETGSGPVGYMDEEPICDLCLLEGNTDLGLVMATIAVVRTYAQSSGTAAQYGEALHELGAYARIYHRAASKSWPARFFRIPGFTTKDDTTTH